MTILGPSLNLTEIFLIFSLLLTQNYAVLFLPAPMLSSTLSLSFKCCYYGLSSIFLLDLVSPIPNHPSSSSPTNLLLLFLLLFLTSQTLKPDRTKPKSNAIGQFSVLSLQVGFGVQYIKTEILNSVQKLSSILIDLNRLHPYF